jgi:CHRD domain
MRRLVLPVVLAAAALAFVVASTALADDDNGGTFRANLDGYAEVVGGPGAASTGSVSTIASGRFTAKLRNGTLHYTLKYSNIEGGTVSQAHIHFAEEHVGGGVIAFLCAGDKPACPQSGTVTGTITSTNVVGPADQGIEAGSFSELIAAMRGGAAYVNVHSTPRFPEGEIRGQIRGGRGGDDDDDDD